MKKYEQVNALIEALERNNITLTRAEASQIINRKIYLSRKASEELNHDARAAYITTDAAQQRWQREADRIGNALQISLERFNDDVKTLGIKAEVMNGYAKITNMSGSIVYVY